MRFGKRFVFGEMASSLMEILRGFENTRDKMMEHLMCVYFQSEAQEINHWINEVRGYVRGTKKVAGRNKWPKEDELYYMLWEKESDSFYDHYWGWLDTNQEFEKEFDWSEARTVAGREKFGKFVEKFIKETIKPLSIRGVILKAEIVEAIKFSRQ